MKMIQLKLIQLGIIALFAAIIVLSACGETANTSRTSSGHGAEESQPQTSTPSREQKMGDSLSTDGNNDVGPSDSLK